MRTIAVVEDNADNRLLITVLLEDRYHVMAFEDGYRAVSGLLLCRPNLVLLDISLPGMDGIETLARIRQQPNLRTLPVVALTAHSMRGDRERFLDAGFDGYLTKPIVDETELYAVLDRLLFRAEVA